MLTCSNCGASNAEGARACRSCGRPFSREPRNSEQRKTVTVVFADVTGSTGLAERLDPELMRWVMSRFFSEMSAILQRHGGSVEKFIGDAVMAVFGVPVVHEDDALRAVRAASEMRLALRSLNEELQLAHGVSLRIRTGVNTGEVLVGDLVAGQTFVTGDAVNVAARLEQTATPDEILIGEDTFRLVRDAVHAEPVGPLRVRGRSESVTCFRLLEVGEEGAGGERPLRSPMVGRIHDLAVLLEALEGTVRDGAPQLVTILGMAGVGKSRLVEELLSGLGEQVSGLRGRCLSYGEGITFWPVGEVIRGACGIRSDATPEEARERIAAQVADEEGTDRIVEGVAQMIGLAGATGTPEETFWGTRRFLETLARERPVVLVFDDVHWGEPTFLDFVEYLADFAAGPLLILCMARLELLEQRPGWGAGRRNAVSVVLEPLTEAEGELLVGNLLGRVSVDPTARHQIIAASEGNPLFIEEMLRTMIDGGVLKQANGGWVTVGEVSTLSVPPTISALLTARLERLDTDERAVAQRGSVVGNVFYWGAVAALTLDANRGGVGTRLQSLVRKDLIVPDVSVFTDEDAFRFRHLLLRDAAYRAIPKETRADLHERFAAWLEEKVGDRATEYEEILGHHLEQAYRYRAEFGSNDERATSLAIRAAERLSSSGRRAFSRRDVPAAVRLLPRAAALLPADHPARPSLLADVGQALMEHGELPRAEEVLVEAAEAARSRGDRGAEAHARLARLLLRLYTSPEGATEAIRSEVEQVIPEFERLADEGGLARSAHLLVEIDWMVCRFGAAEENLERTITHARLAGDRRMEMEALGRLAAAVLFGPTPADEGIRRCREIHERSGGDRRVEAAVLSVEAQLRAMLGRFEGTREQIARARGILDELGLRFFSTAPSEAMAFVEMLADNPAAAERELRWGYEALERMGERGFLSTAAAELAQALYAQERFDEAERFARISESSAASDDLASQVPARSIRAKVLARRGSAEEAERLAREAVELAERTDNLNLRGDALGDLSVVHGLAGRGSDAASLLERAAGVYEEKGNLVSARKARMAQS